LPPVILVKGMDGIVERNAIIFKISIESDLFPMMWNGGC